MMQANSSIVTRPATRACFSEQGPEQPSSSGHPRHPLQICCLPPVGPMPTGGGGGGGGTSRRQYWGLLIGLALCCSALYLLLYYRVSLASPSTFLFSRSSSSLQRPSTSVPPATTLRPPTDSIPPLPVYNWTVHNNASNTSTSTSGRSNNSSETDPGGGKGGNSVSLLTLFSTWVNREDLKVVRTLTLRNWAQLKPLVNPVLFSNDSTMVVQAQRYGWHTLPVSKSAIGVPILKNMYLDAMSRFNSTLYAFANGDILFTDSLLDSLITILKDPSLPIQKHPLLVIGQRTNVAMVSDQEALTFANITRVAKARGKLFTTMAEDFFITDRRFPWDSIPGVVVGRAAYDNWLVLHAIQKKHVVVDVTRTSPAVHQTTKKGNYEGFSHANSSYNDNVLKRLYKRIHYMGGCVDCAPWRTLRNSEGKVVVEKVAKRPKHC